MILEARSADCTPSRRAKGKIFSLSGGPLPGAQALPGIGDRVVGPQPLLGDVEQVHAPGVRVATVHRRWPGADLARHLLIGWEAGTTGVNVADWLTEAAPASAVVYRTSSLVNQFVPAGAGIG